MRGRALLPYAAKMWREAIPAAHSPMPRLPMKTSSLATLLLLPLAVLAQTTPLLDVTDPQGDDVGDGSLVYPRDSAYQPGDLDLRSLRVFADGRDLRFEASFRNPIRHPSTVMSPWSAGATPTCSRWPGNRAWRRVGLRRSSCSTKPFARAPCCESGRRP